MKIKSFLLISVITLIAFTANAGLLQPAIVNVDLVNMSATGDMATARFSDNDVEFIGCGTRNILNADGTVTSFGFCQAEDAEEEQFTCFSFDTALVEKMSTGNDFSFVTFNWNEDGDCTRVGFSTQSFYLPEFQGNGNNGNGNGNGN